MKIGPIAAAVRHLSFHVGLVVCHSSRFSWSLWSAGWAVAYGVFWRHHSPLARWWLIATWKRVQHPTGGVVGELRIRDGQSGQRLGKSCFASTTSRRGVKLAIVSKALDELHS